MKKLLQFCRVVVKFWNVLVCHGFYFSEANAKGKNRSENSVFAKVETQGNTSRHFMGITEKRLCTAPLSRCPTLITCHVNLRCLHMLQDTYTWLIAQEFKNLDHGHRMFSDRFPSLTGCFTLGSHYLRLFLLWSFFANNYQ